MSLTLETIRNSPEYSEDSLITRAYEAELYRNYDRPGYWLEELADEVPA